MPPARRFCADGHDTSVVGRTRRHCNVCARAARDRYALTPKGRAATEKANDRYVWSAKGMIARMRIERNRER
jgi:hypothetical protein